MREILFRGKRIDNGEWVQGDLSQHKTGKNFIKCGNAISSYEVIPETVGQYTGLTDKNGTKVFEGDIIDIHYENTIVRDAVVKYIGASFYGETVADTWELDDYYKIEVIGNIHDNPELVRGEEEWITEIG